MKSLYSASAFKGDTKLVWMSPERIPVEKTKVEKEEEVAQEMTQSRKELGKEVENNGVSTKERVEKKIHELEGELAQTLGLDSSVVTTIYFLRGNTLNDFSVDLEMNEDLEKRLPNIREAIKLLDSKHPAIKKELKRYDTKNFTVLFATKRLAHEEMVLGKEGINTKDQIDVLASYEGEPIDIVRSIWVGLANWDERFDK